MAEEKIKAAEVMSDDELDGVAGGNAAETQKDLNFLRAVVAIGQDEKAVVALMTRAFASHGIGIVIHGDARKTFENPTMNNEYFIGGKQVTREAALTAMASKMKAKTDLNTGEAFDIQKYL